MIFTEPVSTTVSDINGRGPESPLKLIDQMKLQRLRRFEEETKLQENAVDMHLRLLESVVMNANDGVLITEAEFIDEPGPRIQYVNPAFTRITGYTPEQVIGKSPRFLQGPLTSPVALKTIRTALDNRHPVETQLINYRSDGSVFWAELSISPVHNEGGALTHWISVLRDISERKANEEVAIRARAAEMQNEALSFEIAERKKIEAKLAHTAFHDDLTGLKNRGYFMDRLTESLLHAQTRQPFQCALIYLDLDGFKAVNDTMGHRAGDLVLIEVARRLEACCRPRDTISRFGGDEFTILLDDIQSLEQVFAVAQRILEKLEEPFSAIGPGIAISGSMGICEVQAIHAKAEDPLRDADTAMYRAKLQGGGRYLAFNEVMHQNATALIQRKSQLKLAVQREEFELFYQPIVNARTLRIVGVEALVRWNHPSRGLLSPVEFIALAEESGTILPLGAWIFRTACQQLKHWQDSLPGVPVLISINVSGKQLEEANFFPDLIDLLAETQVDARSLQIEVTETMLLKDPDRVAALFAQIRKVGIRIALDDFGTGYSSLGYLEKYPIDSLKIDKSFVDRLGEGSTKKNIVRMIIDLARDLGLEVFAEGIQNVHQSDALMEYGCNLVQGYLYSPPLPAGEMSLLLNHGLRASGNVMAGVHELQMAGKQTQ
jgi:diguanylate cyclase (GGDEF)-like protein/PAS domain S-box-containing protein